MPLSFDGINKSVHKTFLSSFHERSENEVGGKGREAHPGKQMTGARVTSSWLLFAFFSVFSPTLRQRGGVSIEGKGGNKVTVTVTWGLCSRLDLSYMKVFLKDLLG